MALLERLMRVYERANPICDADDNLQKLFRDSRWPKLRRALIEHGIVRVDKRNASGGPKEFLRRQFPPDEIMRGASKSSTVQIQISKFWDAIEGSAI